MANLVYSPKDILQQEFKKKKCAAMIPLKLDEFLDNIIKDYETYSKELPCFLQGRETHRLSAKVAQLSKNSRRSPNTCAANRSTGKSAAVTNFDILKRLSNLEREVFCKSWINKQVQLNQHNLIQITTQMQI